MPIRKLVILIILLFSTSLAFAAAIPNWPTFYDSFEDDTVDTLFQDGDGGPWATTAPACCGDDERYESESADQTEYIRDDLTARYGDQYLHIKAQWTAAESCNGHYSAGFGNYGFRRGYILFLGDELTDGIGLDINNGTEYWIAWSQYIPADEMEQPAPHGESGLFQIQTNAGLSSIMYWGMDNGKQAIRRYYDS